MSIEDIRAAEATCREECARLRHELSVARIDASDIIREQQDAEDVIVRLRANIETARADLLVLSVAVPATGDSMVAAMVRSGIAHVRTGLRPMADDDEVPRDDG